MKTKTRKIRRLTHDEAHIIAALAQACKWMLIYDKSYKDKTLTESDAVDYQQLRDKWLHYPLSPDDCF